MRPTIVLIIAPSRSGTTITDMAVGTHPDIMSLGEVARIPKAFRDRHRCTCGRIAPECPIWSAVGDTTDDVVLFRRVMQAAGVPVLVDSSKDVRRAAALRRRLAPHFRVLVLHVVRDVRGWGYSQQKAAGRHPGREARPRQLGRQWARNHLVYTMFGWTMPRRYMRVRYRDLCTNPRDVVGQIHQWIGVRPVPFDGRLEGEYHLCTGNPTRLVSATVDGPEEPWRSGSEEASPAVYGVAAAIMQRVLGYH